MATLFNTKISATYEGLLKTIDNAAISATLRELTDGSGNQSGLYLNTAGDFKVTNVLEWGSLKDTGTGVTITQFVTSTDGIENFNNNTTLPTSAAVKLYVDTKFSQTDTLTEVLGFGNTTSGKDIAVSAGDDITFTNSSKILMGAGSDLQIYHDGSNSFIRDTGTGDLKLQASNDIFLLDGSGNVMIEASESGSIDLFYSGNKKFETTLLGSTVTGDLLVTGTITGAGGSFLPLAGGTMTGNIVLNDNVKTVYGTASDGLEIYHDGTASFIKDSGTGNFNIQTDSSIFFEQTSGANMAVFRAGTVELNYNGSNKFETTNTGAKVNGFIQVTNGVDVTGGNIDLLDNSKIRLGASQDLQIYHDGSDSYIKEIGTGTLRFQSNGGAIDFYKDSTEFLARFKTDSGIELYFDGTKRLETLTDGAKVTGNLEVTGTITGAGGSFLPLIGGTMTGDTIHNDSVKSIYGTASDGLEIFHDGINSYIKDTGTGGLTIQANADFALQSTGTNENFITAATNAFVKLYFNGNEKIATTNTGISVTGGGGFSGNVEMAANNINFANNGKARFGNQANLQIHSDGSNSYIDNAGVTQSTFFRVSDANSLDTTALIISRNGDLTTGRDVTIAGDLTVNGTTTTVNSQTLSVDDPLISLAINNAANSLDIGYYGKYNDGTTRYLGLYNDASDSNKFKLFKGTTVEPTTTVNIGGAGYVAADLQVAGLEASNGIFSDVATIETKLNGNDSALNFTTAGGDVFRIGVKDSDNSFRISNSATSLATDTRLTIDSSGNTTFAGNLDLLDNKILNIGTGNDIQIKHLAGANSYIGNFTGDLYIDQTADDKSIIFRCDNGSGGLETYFQLEGASGGASPFTVFPDNSNLTLGTGHDFRLYHNGTDSLIENYTGDLTFAQYADDKDIIFKSDNGSGGTENYIQIDGSEGRTTFNKNIRLNDNVKAQFGGSADLQIYHDGSNSFIQDTGTGSLKTVASGFQLLNASQNQFMILADGGGTSWVKLYYAGSERLATTSTGVSVTGDGTFSGTTTVQGTGDSSFVGNVGIGTDSPIAIGGHSGILTLYGSNATALVLKDVVSEGHLRFDDSNFKFTNNVGDVRMQVETDTGNVGIGTTAPAAMLHVKEPSGSTSQIKMSAASNEANYGYLTMTDNTINTAKLTLGTTFGYNTQVDAMTIFNGNVGIGTASPSEKLEVEGSLRVNRAGSSAQYGIFGQDSNGGFINYQRPASGTLYENFRFIASNQVGSVERMRIDSDGNVGIGTDSPDTALDVVGGNADSVVDTLTLKNDSTGNSAGVGINFVVDGVNDVVTSAIYGQRTGPSYHQGSLQFLTKDSSGGGLLERMRITSAGDVLIGTDSPITSLGRTLQVKSNSNLAYFQIEGSSGSIVFRNASNSTVGTITVAATSTAYNTSSDYRLKEDLQDFAGLEMVSKIPVYDFKWKTDESRSYGVMAHELQEVLPDAVSGEKDAEEMQGVDYSKIVPLLIKSIQELTAKVERLEAK